MFSLKLIKCVIHNVYTRWMSLIVWVSGLAHEDAHTQLNIAIAYSILREIGEIMQMFEQMKA